MESRCTERHEESLARNFQKHLSALTQGFVVSVAALVLSPATLAQPDSSEFVIDTVVGSDPARDGGPAASALLAFPDSVAVDAAGNLYIADTSNWRVRRVASDGVITTLAGTGTGGFCCRFGGSGTATESQLAFVRGLAVDHVGNVFVADSLADQILRVGVDGVISAVGGRGFRGGRGDGGLAVDADLNSPFDVAVGGAGNIYVADNGNHRIRKVTPGGTISTVVGTGTQGFGGDGGRASSAAPNFPRHLGLNGDGNLYIADGANHRIRKVAVDGTISTVAGTGVPGFSGDGGRATEAQLAFAQDVAVDSNGTIYVADTTNSRIRTVTSEGVISTAVGMSHLSGDGALATDAVLFFPWDVATDNAGNLYVADTNNHAVRCITPDGVINTVAGTGDAGFGADGGLAIETALAFPRGVAVDGSGSIYIADTGTNRVRKVSPEGVISKVAGTGKLGFSGDGGLATDADLDSPVDLAVDGSGSIYIGDIDNNQIRKVSTDGVISTVAGTGLRGFGGDGGLATSAAINIPIAVTVDGSGNIYFADRDNHRIRRISSAGVISTVAGNGLFSGLVCDGGPATEAQVASPWGCCGRFCGQYLCGRRA